MAENELKQFLREQARSLDSLLELTPAKNMFGEDVSDQWKRKKQTPEEKKAARMAKLDPANWKSAKDVYDERSAEAAKKRKRAEKADTSDVNVNDTPKQGQPSKRQKTNDSTAKPVINGKVGDLETPDQIVNKNLRKKMKKRANRLEKNQEMREQKERRKAEKAAQRTTSVPTSTMEARSKPKKPSQSSGSSESRQSAVETMKHKAKAANSQVLQKAAGKPHQIVVTEGDEEADGGGGDTDKSDTEEKSQEFTSESALSAAVEQIGGPYNDGSVAGEDESGDEEIEDASSTASSSELVPDILSPPQDSAASSVSSMIPPPTAQQSSTVVGNKKDAMSSKPSTLPEKTLQSEAERLAARKRLQDQISQFRSQRKADDKPVRSRAELLEQRRRSEAERKAAKKEQRQKQKEEEARIQDEEMARRFSPGGSGSLLASPRSPIVDAGTNEAFTFGRIAFEDGTQLDPNTLSAMANKRQKGASDPASALKAVQAKKARIAGLDDDKKQDIEEKDMWLNARKRAHGERVKDDTSLLKKALKRQEKQKQRSGKDWDERTEGVRASQEARQKKRSENLQKRKDEKSGKKSGKKVKRPGFEGSFRGRTGKPKKK